MMEPMRDSYRDLIVCNDSILRELNHLRESQVNLIATVTKEVEGALRGDVLDLRRELRTEMAKLGMSHGALVESQQQLTTILLERPCVANGNCAVDDEEKR